MAKLEKLEFDYEEYFDSMFKTTAVLMWSTHISSFSFAFFLNKLYGLTLQRKESVTLNRKSGDAECVVYTCQDNVLQTAWFLIENSVGPDGIQAANSIFDKVLLIMGPDAYTIAADIFNDIDKQPIDGYDAEHIETRRSLIDSGILESALFDFSDPDRPDTTYFPHTNNPSLAKKRLLFLKEQREYVTDLLLALDSLLPDYEEI